MSVVSIADYKAATAIQGERRAHTLDFIMAEKDAAEKICNIFSYRPPPLSRILAPGAPQFQKAGLDPSHFQSLNTHVFLESVLNNFILPPLDKFMIDNGHALQCDMQKIQKAPNAACRELIEKYHNKYAGYFTPGTGWMRADFQPAPLVVDKNKVYAASLRELEEKLCAILDKKREAIKSDWTAAVKSATTWRAWGSSPADATLIPSQEMRNLALQAFACAREDMRNAVAALHAWPAACFAIDQRKHWLKDEKNQEMFRPFHSYVALAYTSGEKVVPRFEQSPQPQIDP